MANINLTDSDEEAIVNFVKDHEELYNKTNEHFKDKARKDCLWERFTVYKTWFESQRIRNGKLTHSKSGHAPKDMTEKENWIQDKFNFLKIQVRGKELGKSSAFKSPAGGAIATIALAHDISRG